MTDDRFDQDLERDLSGMARAARRDVEAGVSQAEVDAALRDVMSGGAPRLWLEAPATSSSRRWILLGVAAASVALVVGVAFAVSNNEDEKIASLSMPSTSADITASTNAPPPSEPTTTLFDPTNTTVQTTVAGSPTTTTTVLPALPMPTLPVTAVDVPVIESVEGLPAERYLPDARCLEDSCAQIEFDVSGTAWTFADGVLTNHARVGAMIELPEPWASVDIRDISLVAIGPDQVAYFNVWTGAERSDLVGISVADGDAGAELVHLVAVLEGSGDTDYVATATGLVAVGCCGVDAVRPATDAEPLVSWLERAGEQPPSPTIMFDADDASITRDGITWSFDVGPQQLMLRGMPQVTAAHDGGVIGRLTGLDGADYVVRGWPDGSSNTVAVTQSLPVRNLSPEGFVIVVGGEAFDEFVAVDVFADHPAAASEPRTVDFDTGNVTLDNGWQPPADDSASARLVRANAVAGAVNLGERRTVEAIDAQASVVVVTTEGFFDDSVFGEQLTIDFASERIGWASSCQPGRGHQDYRSALCA